MQKTIKWLIIDFTFSCNAAVMKLALNAGLFTNVGQAPYIRFWLRKAVIKKTFFYIKKCNFIA